MPAMWRSLRTRLVAEGANIPCTAEAEEALAARGVLVLPDFIANAGGVICAAVEYRRGTETVALAVIDEKIRANTRAVLDEARRAPERYRAARSYPSPPSGCVGRCRCGGGVPRGHNCAGSMRCGRLARRMVGG